MLQEEVSILLGQKNMSKTPCRVEVLRVLLESGSALSEPDIRSRLNGGFDRTTVYRTLRSFLDQDVIHSISLEGGTVMYAITHQKEKHAELFHSHFFCDDCSKVYCLTKPEFEPPVLPEGFKANGYDLLINGTCNNCS